MDNFNDDLDEFTPEFDDGLDNQDIDNESSNDYLSEEPTANENLGSASKINKKVILLAVVCLILLIALCVVLGTGAKKLVGQPEATPTDVSVIVVVPSETPIPSPTKVPSTPTPLPTATATPIPAALEITYPENIPMNLPSYVSWSISLIDGDAAKIEITNLGNSMLATDDDGEIVIQRSLAMNSIIAGKEWIVEGVIDPNAGSGVLSLTITGQNGIVEVVDIPWESSDIPMVQYGSRTVVLDGASRPEVQTDTSATSLGRPIGYANHNWDVWSFLYPDTWFLGEDADIVTVANNPQLIVNEPSPDISGTYVILSSESRSEDLPEDVLKSFLDPSMSGLTIETLVVDGLPSAYVAFSGEDEVGEFSGIIGVVLNASGGDALIIQGMIYDVTDTEELFLLLNSIEKA